jgi:hypothetical protein
MALNLKEFDFKQFLLGKGERVGVVVAGLVTLVLVGLALLGPGHGLRSSSPEENAKNLGKDTALLKSQTSNPNPTLAERDLPPPGADKGLSAAEFVRLDPSTFRPAPFGPAGEGGGGGGRGVPRVLKLAEARAQAARVQVGSFIIIKDKIYTLQEKGVEAPKTGFADASLVGRLYGREGGPRMPLAGRPGKGKLPLPGLPGGGEVKEEKTLKVVPVELAKVQPTDRLAKQVLPVRLAVIAASFPLKEQLEELQRKLGLPNLEAVLAEKSLETDENGKLLTDDEGKPLPAVRFLGVKVERREVDAAGNPLRDARGQPVEWKPVNLDDDYEHYLYLTGNLTGERSEPDDPRYERVTVPGLVMPRLFQFREEEAPAAAREGPPGKKEGEAAPKSLKSQYPAVEGGLPRLKAALDALKDNTEAPALAPEPFRKGKTSVFVRKGKRPPAPPSSAEAKGDPKESGVEVPSHCLVRVVDVTVQPGKNYKYRLSVLMSNPNLNRKVGGPDGVVNPDHAKKPSLESEPFEVPDVVRVEPERRFYAVDQKELAAEPGKYKGPHWKEVDRQALGSRPPGHFEMLKSRHLAVLQVHRWLQFAPTRDTRQDSELIVGEWTVAERMPVYRGEYVGHKERVEVPVWQYWREQFAIAQDSSTNARKGAPGIEVDFGFGRSGPTGTDGIVVDFDSGRGHAYQRGADKKQRIADTCAQEVLLLSPDGNLMLLEGGRDARDSDRVDRLRAVKARLDEVKDPDRKKGENKKKPFGR